MNLLRPVKKAGYHKNSTRDLSQLKRVVRPDLKKRDDETFSALVNNINRNTTNR
jgi:hypothetical protein